MMKNPHAFGPPGLQPRFPTALVCMWALLVLPLDLVKAKLCFFLSSKFVRMILQTRFVQTGLVQWTSKHQGPLGRARILRVRFWLKLPQQIDMGSSPTVHPSNKPRCCTISSIACYSQLPVQEDILSVTPHPSNSCNRVYQDYYLSSTWRIFPGSKLNG